MEAVTQPIRNSADAVEHGERALVRLLLEEHPDSPWNDRRLGEMLASRGIRLGSRSVGRYRQRLAIPSSHGRRLWSPALRERELERLRQLVGLGSGGESAGERGELPTEEPVLFSSGPPSNETLAELQLRLAEAGQDLAAGDKTLSNIPAILRELLTPTHEPAGGSRLEMASAAQETGPEAHDSPLSAPDAALLESWSTYHEFRAADWQPPEAEAQGQEEWHELAGTEAGADVGAELADAVPILDRIFGAPPSTSEAGAERTRKVSAELSFADELSEPDEDGSDLFELVDEDTDLLFGRDSAGPEETPPSGPLPERAPRQPVQEAQVPQASPELEETRPEQRTPARRAAGRARKAAAVPWSELWPFPKYRRLVDDIPALSRVPLRNSTLLLRPMLASRLKDAHRLYLNGDVDKSAEMLAELCECNSSSVRFWAHLLLAEIRLVYDGDLEQARELAAEAVELTARAGRPQLLLAITMYLQDDLQAARELLEEYRESGGSSPTARLVLGLVMLEQGELSRGIAEMETARKKIDFPQELNERIRHAREVLKAGLAPPGG
jgi:hypothetical protein